MVIGGVWNQLIIAAKGGFWYYRNFTAYKVRYKIVVLCTLVFRFLIGDNSNHFLNLGSFQHSVYHLALLMPSAV
jgi:hypothetical protein